MPTFLFEARDSTGRPQRGTLEAASANALVSSLRQRGWLVLNVQAASDAVAPAAILARLNPFAWLPPRMVDVELSLQQIAVMLRSGLTLLTALRTVAEQARRQKLHRIWEHVAERIQEGASFADAMSAYRCFPRLVVQLVRVGEQSGSLELVLTRAAAAMESQRNLRTSLLTALAYPSIVLVMALGVTTLMLLVLIPKLQKLLQAFGRKLPAMTQMLLDLSTFVQTYLPHLLLGVLLISAALVLLYLWPPGRLALDRFILRVPLLGPIFRLAGTVTFAQGLGILTRSGITLLEGLRTVEQLHSNRYLASRVSQARLRVLQGSTLAEPLAASRAFMPMLSRMVAVGESAGTLDEVLDEVARFHEAQLQRAIRQLSVLVEPAIIVIVGGIVGFVYASFFIALFAAAGAVR